MSESINAGDMPQDYWAWTDEGKLIPLGICEDFDEASERADTKAPSNHWIFSRQGLEEFKAEILRELPDAAHHQLEVTA